MQSRHKSESNCYWTLHCHFGAQFWCEACELIVLKESRALCLKATVGNRFSLSLFAHSICCEKDVSLVCICRFEVCSNRIMCSLTFTLWVLLQEFTCDIGPEQFLGPEIFFNPEIYCSEFSKPLPQMVDDVIQLCPIDTKRALYGNIVLSVSPYFNSCISFYGSWVCVRGCHQNHPLRMRWRWPYSSRMLRLFSGQNIGTDS